MGMIKINDRYYVDVETKVLTLKRLVGVTKGNKLKYEIIGYYSSWEMVFDRLYRIFIAERIPGKIKLTQFKEIIENARSEIKEIAKKCTDLKVG